MSGGQAINGTNELAWRRMAEVGADILYKVTGVKPEKLFARVRKSEVNEARQCLMYVLKQYGATVAVIGRALDRDHSTVLHGLKGFQRRLDTEEAAETPPVERASDILEETLLVFALACPGGIQDMQQERLPVADMERLLTKRLPLSALTPVLTYLHLRVLGTRLRMNGPQAAQGLWMIARTPSVQVVVLRVLARCGLAHVIPTLRQHAGFLGYRWVPACA